MPPCNCHPPFPRPEPFSPLPRPGKIPDWGKWIRDRLSEKGALLAFPSASAFPDPGAQPNVYEALDTGTLYRWDGAHYQVLVDPSAANDVLEYEDRGRFPETGHHGKLYIAADAGSLYRWGGEGYVELLEGKADKAAPQTAGNFAALTQDGNLADSGKKPSDFADAANTYTKAETDEAIDRVAAYYITYDAAGNPFPTYAALANAQTVYSGGQVRVPTRNDYCVVLADETHQGAEYRYIYAVAEGQTTGSWQPQFPVEGVMTVDPTVQKNSQNPVSGGGVWSAIWGALAALPTGFASLYDWCVEQLAGKASKADATLTPIYSDTPTFSGWTYSGIPDGWVVEVPPRIETDPEILQYYNWSMSLFNGEFSQYLYSTSAVDSNEVVFDIPGEGTVTATRTRTDIIGYTLGSQDDKPLASEAEAEALRTGKLDKSDVVTPSTSATSGQAADAKATGAVLAAKAQNTAVVHKTGNEVIDGEKSFVSDVKIAGGKKLYLDDNAPGTVGGVILKIGNDYMQWFGSLPGVARKVYFPASAGTLALAAPSVASANNLAALDANGNPTDSGVKPSDKLDSNSAAPAFSTSSTYAVDERVTYNGKLYRCTTAVTTAGAWDASKWTADTMTDPDAVLDITSQNQLRVVAKDGTLLWAQGYDLASTSSATLACDATNNFTFADGATTQAFALPAAPTGKVGDFGLDIDNSANTSAATMTLTGLDTTFSVVVPEGESLNDMLAIAAGELARFYVTLTTFRVNNLPTWHIVKQVVENGGATA